MPALSESVFPAVFLALVTVYFPQLLLPEYRPRATPLSQVTEEYDFIIVGAGTAGSVLAHRLSEVEEWEVAVFEAGGDETPFSKTPLHHFQLQNTELDWNYTTVPQENACGVHGGVCKYTRGRVLGGCSSIDGMVYSRGSRYDYDSWEEAGLIGWGYDDVLPYFLRSEHAVEKELIESRFHSQGGPLNVQFPRYSPKIVEDFISAGDELGLSNRDYNGKNQSGISVSQLMMKGAQRWSTASAFLTSASRRSNLDIIKNTEINKIVIDPRSKAALGVKFKANDVTWFIKARKEVIVSAGALNTPKLLMLSGIGPKDHLTKLKIPVVSNLHVGDNLQDHAMVMLPVMFAGHVTTSPKEYWSVESLLEFAVDKTGPLTSSFLSLIAFCRIEEGMQDPPDLQLEVIPVQTAEVARLSNRSLGAIAVSVLQPQSRGTVRLRSANPDDPPLVDPRFFTSEDDVKKTIQGLRVATHWLKTDALKPYSPKVCIDLLPKCKVYEGDENKLLACLVYYYSDTMYDPIGTAKMGEDEDIAAVLNRKLQVRGVNKLRVVDASVMPRIIRGGTTAPVIMIAEKAADMIKKCYKQPLQSHFEQ